MNEVFNFVAKRANILGVFAEFSLRKSCRRCHTGTEDTLHLEYPLLSRTSWQCRPRLRTENRMALLDETTSRSTFTRYIAVTIVVFAGYFVAGRLGQATTSIRSSNLGPVWPAYGVALAAFLIYNRRALFGIASAAFIVALLSPVSPITAAGQATGATLAAFTGASLLRRRKFDNSLGRL